jgi:hypothetical protein
MSEDENLAVVRRTLECFANDVETWLDTLDPAVKWYPGEEHQTLLLGRDAALRRRERWRETFQEGGYMAPPGASMDPNWTQPGSPGEGVERGNRRYAGDSGG